MHVAFLSRNISRQLINPVLCVREVLDKYTLGDIHHVNASECPVYRKDAFMGWQQPDKKPRKTNGGP